MLMFPFRVWKWRELYVALCRIYRISVSIIVSDLKNTVAVMSTSKSQLCLGNVGIQPSWVIWHDALLSQKKADNLDRNTVSLKLLLPKGRLCSNSDRDRNYYPRLQSNQSKYHMERRRIHCRASITVLIKTRCPLAPGRGWLHSSVLTPLRYFSAKKVTKAWLHFQSTRAALTDVTKRWPASSCIFFFLSIYIVELHFTTTLSHRV